MQIYLATSKRVSLQSLAENQNDDEWTSILQGIKTSMHEDLFAFYFFFHKNLSKNQLKHFKL